MNIKIYDNGGKTVDRYTVIFLDFPERGEKCFAALAMNEYPFNPQGFGQHCTATPGRHLGRRINLKDLPKDCRRLVFQDLKDLYV